MGLGFSLFIPLSGNFLAFVGVAVTLETLPNLMVVFVLAPRIIFVSLKSSMVFVCPGYANANGLGRIGSGQFGNLLFPAPNSHLCVRKRGVTVFFPITTFHFFLIFSCYLGGGAEDREMLWKGTTGEARENREKYNRVFSMSRRALIFRILFPCVEILGWHRSM